MKVLKEIRSIEKLDLIAKKIVEGYLLGLHRSPFHGFSAEFREHKQYNEGDNLKNIDYKVYARTDKLFIKKYDEETNLKCQLVLDVSPSMYYPEGQVRSKIDFSIVAIASLMTLLKRQRDAHGLTIFSDMILEHIEPKINEKTKQQIYATLLEYSQKHSGHSKSKVLESLDQLAYSLSKRSLIVVFSDFLDIDSEPDFDNKFNQVMQHLIFQKHDLILFHVIHKASEVDFEYDHTPREFIDLESGEKIKLIPTEVQKDYTMYMQNRLLSMKKKCIQYGVDMVEIDIDANYEQVLSAYLRRRKKK